MAKQTIPYGLWPSPITPTSLAQERRLSDVVWDNDGETLVWLEGRSERGVLVCAGPGGDAPRDLTSALSVRARVGYGGGDFTVARGQVYFSAEGRLYRQALAEGEAQPLTPALGEMAAPAVSPDGRWLLYVYHLEGYDGIALVDTEGVYWPQKLLYGHDFYMQPTWHPDGQQVAWIAWDHPQMPWDGTLLGLATLDLSRPGLPGVVEQSTVTGDRETAISQPTFSPNGRYLAYLSDVTGWDNLYLYDLETHEHRPLVLANVDLGVPAWSQGVRTYCWSPDSATVYYLRNEQGFWQMWSVEVETGKTVILTPLATYSELAQPTCSANGHLAMLASSARVPRRLVTYTPGDPARKVWVRARTSTETVPPEALSGPEPISWRSGGEEAHGLFYAPESERYESAGQPPLIVLVHGGPTGQATARYAPNIQFLTTRGYAVLEVNYRGSTGYGRIYRNKLRSQWGVYDVDDAVNGARHLAEQKRVDEGKMVIMGGSAGGYTVLMALIRHPGVFKAGVCMYGVTNLFTLAADTHKFEARYLDSMIGPLPETAALYRERSPLFAAEQIKDPVAIFQGEEDRVVPKEQAETIVAALRRQGVPHEYHLYPGEGHGWRKSETIRAFYEALDKFLKQYVLFA